MLEVCSFRKFNLYNFVVRVGMVFLKIIMDVSGSNSIRFLTKESELYRGAGLSW